MGRNMNYKQNLVPDGTKWFIGILIIYPYLMPTALFKEKIIDNKKFK